MNTTTTNQAAHLRVTTRPNGVVLVDLDGLVVGILVPTGNADEFEALDMMSERVGIARGLWVAAALLTADAVVATAAAS